MQVTVIIVNYKTKELTAKAIQSVFDKTEGVEYEITVVDNASNDGSIEYLKQQFSNRINLIESKENLGFGRANNVAIRQSKAKYVFLLNSDTELINNAIKIFYDFMEQSENSNVGVCGGNLYDSNYNPAISYGFNEYSILYILCNKLKKFFLKFITLFTNKKLYLYFNYSNKIKEVGMIIGADMFIKKSVLQKSGLFDETIFLYYEDNDLNFRIKKEGYRIKSVPAAKIIHIDHGSSKENADNHILKIYRMQRNNYYKILNKFVNKKIILFYIGNQIIAFIKYISFVLLPDFIKNKIFINKYSKDLYKQMIIIERETYIKVINKNIFF